MTIRRDQGPFGFDVLIDALAAVGNELQLLHAAGTGLAEKHLEEAFCRYYDDPGGRGTRARRQAPYRSPCWQPNPGGIDLAVSWSVAGEARTGWAEVKWGGGKLWNCAWDLAKMALAVQSAMCDEAYLIAGAPQEDWERGVEGAEYFYDGVWDMADDVLRRYHRHWLFWKREVKTRPLKLPARIATAVVAESPPITLDGVWWTVAVVQLHTVTSSYIEIGDDRLPSSHRPTDLQRPR